MMSGHRAVAAHPAFVDARSWGTVQASSSGSPTPLNAVAFLSLLGTSSRCRPRKIASSARSNGASTGCRRHGQRHRPAARVSSAGSPRRWPTRKRSSATDPQTPSSSTPEPTTDAQTARPARSVSRARSSRRTREQHRARALVSGGRAKPRSGARRGRRGRAVVVLPQWNSDAGGHVGLSRLLARFGISALRLSLPYHDARMPPELTRADYIVSSNVVRTVQVCRQAVLDARRAVAWLVVQGFERIGILGTSLGSCLSMLTAAHEPLHPGAGAESRVAVVCRRRLARAVDPSRARRSRRSHRARDACDDLWRPISPWAHLDRVARQQTARARCCVYATLRPDVSRSTCRRRWSASTRAAASRTRWPCCRAATTAPGSRRSSSSTRIS